MEQHVEAGELVAAAYHEVGHWMACWMMGGVGLPHVWRYTTSAIAAGERAWRGQFVMPLCPGSIPPNHRLNIRRCPKRWQVLVGLAGLVAEAIQQGTQDAHDVAVEIDDLIFLGEVSTSDLHLIGDRWREADIANVLRLLVDGWAVVEVEAQHMIQAGGNGPPRFEPVIGTRAQTQDRGSTLCNDFVSRPAA